MPSDRRTRESAAFPPPRTSTTQVESVTPWPDAMNLKLDRRGGTPLYVQLKHHIVYLIGSGELPPGTGLPSVRQLAADLELAPATVQRTYADLQSQGMLVGIAGRGVFVADVATLSESEANHLASMRLLLNRVVKQVGDAGLSEDEIVGTVRDVLARNRARPVPRVVFVAGSMAFAELNRGYLRDALSDLKCDIEVVLLSDLQKRGDAVLDALEPIRCLVSVVGTYTELRRLAGHRATILFPLIVDLTEETQSALMRLSPDARIGLVAEKHLLATRSVLVNHYRGTEEGLQRAAIDDRVAVRAVLRSCTIIIHSAGAFDSLAAQVRPGTKLIEMRYRPNAASLTRLRALLLDDDAGTTRELADGSTTVSRSQAG
jgi:DNA-binding transcriptional regulator YhcF (GntR family)